ncbi:MAG: tetratricopeptide repeat protein [Thermoanaerobaculaceae bacterium]|nr:tetratricopeptide repeat protein [Thermoanaerobaculaceae bacterium]
MLVGVLLAVAGVAGAQEPAQPKGSVVDEVLLKPTRTTSAGRSLYDEGNYPKALDRFTEASQTRPSDARARFNLADALYKAGKLDEAGALFRALGERDDAPLAFESRYNLGNVELARQKFPDAVGAYRRALKLRQDDADTRRNLELALRAIEQQKQQEQQNQQNQQDQRDQHQQQGQQNQQGPQQDQQKQNREQQERERFQREAGMPKEQAMQLLSALEQTEKDEQKRQLQALRAVRKKGKDW